MCGNEGSPLLLTSMIFLRLTICLPTQLDDPVKLQLTLDTPLPSFPTPFSPSPRFERLVLSQLRYSTYQANSRASSTTDRLT
jgi:hypothetical protein